MLKTVRGDANKLLMDILCLKLWEELLTLTTGGYLMLKTVMGVVNINY